MALFYEQSYVVNGRTHPPIVLALAVLTSDVRAGPKALKPARPGPEKPEPCQAL